MIGLKIAVSDDLPDYEDILSRYTHIVAERVRDRMRRKLNSESKHGRTYGWHTASARGEAPASFSGALSASLQIEDMLMESLVYSSLDEDYPALLENQMERPLWQESMDEEIPFAENLLVEMMS